MLRELFNDVRWLLFSGRYAQKLDGRAERRKTRCENSGEQNSTERKRGEECRQVIRDGIKCIGEKEMEIARSDTIPRAMINCIRLTMSGDLAFPISYWRRRRWWWCYSLLYSSLFLLLAIVSRALNAWRPGLETTPALIRSIRLTITSKRNVKPPPMGEMASFQLGFVWKSPALLSTLIETSTDRCWIVNSIYEHASPIISWSRRVHPIRRVIFVWRTSIKSKACECKEQSPCVHWTVAIEVMHYSVMFHFSSLYCLFHSFIDSNKFFGQIQKRC